MKRIITISREFGSGGHSIGKKLADQLGYRYYDKELVKAVAAETGFHPDFIEEHGELAFSGSPLSYAFGSPGVPGTMKGMTMNDFLWCMQREVILKIAEEEPCVIVGRCADYILRDRDDALHVFIHAPLEYKAERIVRLYGSTEKTPEQRLKDKDKRRKVNYKHYTGRDWGQAQNYDLCLNSATLGEQGCVNAILASVGSADGQ